MVRKYGRLSQRKGVFNPEDEKRVKHTRLGVWDLYEERNSTFERIPGSTRIEKFLEIKQNLPYVWQMLKDISSIKSCWLLLFYYAVVVFIRASIPAVNLWFKGQLLTIVQVAVETRTVDKSVLFKTTLGIVTCKLATRIISHLKSRISNPLSARLKHHYAVHLYRARARLDVPTFDDPAVQAQLDAASHVGGKSVAWQTFLLVSNIASTAVQVVSLISVLWSVLKDQPDGKLLAGISAIHTIGEWVGEMQSAWAATTTNQDFIRLQGLKKLVSFPEHRKEFVAGNLSSYTTQLFKMLTDRVGDEAADFWESMGTYRTMSRLKLSSFLGDSLSELPLIVFALRAVDHPASIPMSLASLQLITETTNSFSATLYRLVEQTGSIAEQLSLVRKLYDVLLISNKIPDGSQPFPENQEKVKTGIAIEFRDVSFRYPGSDNYALHEISFKLDAGQLCVIVGANGSGKSTILKLLVRLYDPLEGEILVDGRDIQSLKLEDLRETISVLFQDYTHFPLSIRDNIGMGDPRHADDEDRIRLAARLGGSEEYIERLPEGIDTYLEKPVTDHYNALPEGTQRLFGKSVDYSAVRRVSGMSATKSTGLSGGQMQRLAVSRTFMRSVVSEDSTVGLLLFDEPSASLDPTAEHDLFRRLRHLKGNKTMLFSSHRFGNLTRHADLILYMNDSRIIETGTHEELLKRDGEYARIWKLQAQAFL
ncbi:P-loop containing nucleoside triphosphate hydrolase protein [Abortiporus biennis]|nr:P-loop containing nucleoside triphosphate hydrolase protein [Abortiporus biennis]